jgi:TRAP-type C4-dicarboxylate transport system substrate-binding protein
VHSNGSLLKHPDIMRAVSSGQVPIGEFLLGSSATRSPVFNATTCPSSPRLRQRLEAVSGAEA